MPKRSLNPRNDDAKKVEQLNRAIDVMLARTDGKPPQAEAGVEPLVRVAADLRDLPRESFKQRLRLIFEGRNQMSATAEPIVGVRQSLSPHLAFKNAAQAMEFYKKAFGAKETLRLMQPDGRVGHAEMEISGATITLSDEFPDYDTLSPETVGGSPVDFKLYVDDVDAVAKQAVAAGAKVIRPVEDQFYGERSGQIADPFGYTWKVSTRKEEVSPEEMQRRLDALYEPAEAKKPAVDPVPRGFHTVTPYMIAEDGDAILAFAKNAFGAEQILRAIGGAGGIHGETRIGDTILMMGGGIPGKPFSGKPNATALHIYVENTDAVYQKALQAGATLISEPQDHEYGERGASVKDPFGNLWYIATHKRESYIPKGLHNVNVYMHPLRAEPVITFLKRAFGAREIAKHASPDGVVHHAEIRVGDSVVEMGESHGKYPPMPAMFYVYVPDCDAVYRRALAAGAKSIQEPADQPYGDRLGLVADPFGNQWCIATHMKDVAM